MLKKIILFFLIVVSLSAGDLKKSDINLILEVMKENNKNIIRIMQENNKRLEEKMEANYKRLEEKMEANYKKLDDKIEQTKKRLEEKIDANYKRLDDKIDAVKTNLESQIKATNKRIDDLKTNLENQIKATNRRIDDVNSYLLSLLAGIFALIGFMWWDRRTMISKAKEEVTKNIQHELNNKANKDDLRVLNNIILVLKDFANSNKDFNNIFQKYNLKVA